MKKRLVAALVLLLVLGSGITAVIVMQRGKETPEAGASPTNEKRPGEDFVARRSRAELEEGIAAAKAEREKEMASSATAENDPAAVKARQMRDQLMESQTPDGAEATARSKLAEIDRQLETATDPADRERLARHKRLVEEVLAKLGKM